MRSPVPLRHGLAVLVLAVATSCGSPTADATATAAVSASAADPGNAGGNKFVTVLTRNLFVGGDILKPFTVPPEEVLATALQVWQDIQASNFPLRARAIAGEIAAADPDLVSLQEVYRFRITALANGAQVQPDLDFLAELQAALAERGLAYDVAAVSPHTHLAIPFQSLGVAISMLDRDAVLVRHDAGVTVRGTTVGDFVTRLPASLGGIDFELTRGYAILDLKKQGVDFTLADAHLEVRNISPQLPEGAVQAAQAAELVGLLADRANVILAGDLNTDPDHPITYWSYGLLAQAGFQDAWLEENAPGSGLTCCFEPARDPDAQLYERIDLVLYRGDFSTFAVSRFGYSADALLQDALGPLWPSDHAGIVATLRLVNPRFVGLE